MVTPAQSSGAASALSNDSGMEARALHGRDHVLGITAVVAESRDEGIFAICKVAAPTGNAGAVLSAVPTDPYALAFLPDS